jgi:hypothetical protein
MGCACALGRQYVGYDNVDTVGNLHLPMNVQQTVNAYTTAANNARNGKFDFLIILFLTIIIVYLSLVFSTLLFFCVLACMKVHSFIVYLF